MNSFTFLSLQKIAAEKELRRKASLLKELVKQDGADKKLVLDFLQKQLSNSSSGAWTDFCRQVFSWLQKQEKRKDSFEINEEKFFAILESDRTPEEKLGMLAALKEHIQYKNSRIIEWIVRESMELSSGYFALVCELADYLLAKDIFSEMGADVSEQDFSDFTVFFRSGFRERIMWLRSCSVHSDRKELLLQWVDNIVLSEANPFVIAEFLRIYPLCLGEEAEEVGRLLDSLPNFLEWPFVQIKVRTLQALAKVAPVMPFSLKVCSIAEKILSGTTDARLRLQAEYLIGLCGDQEADAAPANEILAEEAGTDDVVGLIWDEEFHDEPDSFLQGFLVPVGEQTREFVRNTKPALLIVFFLVLTFLLVYFLVGDANLNNRNPVVRLGEELEKANSLPVFVGLCRLFSMAQSEEGTVLSNEEQVFFTDSIARKYDELLPLLSYGQLYLLRIFCAEGTECWRITGEQRQRLLLERIQQMESQAGILTSFPPSAQAVRTSEPGLVIYWRNQPFSALPGNYGGQVEIRYANGAVFLEANFSDGHPDGRLGVFSPDGRLITEENYVQGHAEGDFSLLYPDGNPAYTYSFAGGVCQGQYLSYDRNGEVVSAFNCDS